MTLSHEIFPKTFLIFFWELTSKVKYKNFVDIKFWVQVVVFLTLPCDLWNDVPTIYLVSGAVFSWDMLLSPFRARMNFETKQLRVKTLLENLFNSTYSKIVLSKSMLSKQKVSKYIYIFLRICLKHFQGGFTAPSLSYRWVDIKLVSVDLFR